MAAGYADIARVLDGARRRQAWVVLATALAAGLAAALLALLAGVALLASPGVPARPVRLATVALAAIGVVSALAWAALALMRRASTPRAVARAVGEGAPALESDLLSAIELEDARGEIAASGRYSVALVDAHAGRTAEAVAALDLARVVPSRPARRAAAVLAGAVALHAAAFAAAPAALGKAWLRLAGAGAPDRVRQAEPITGDVEITYLYPAYMRREPRTISGTGGEVSAPKGTEVRLRTRADRPVEKAEIVFERAGGSAERAPSPRPSPSEGERGNGRPGGEKGSARPGGERANGGPGVPGAIALQVAKDGRDLSGGFAVEESGAYRFRFLKGRKAVAEGPALPVTVEPDAFPEVRITAPADEVEVDARARVHVEWNASDDVGLAELTLVTKPPEGEERRTALRSFDGTRHDSGAFDLDLAPYRLAEGEKILYWLEAADGDVVSGPKRSASSTHVAKVYSEAEHHRAALAKAQSLWEDLVRLLGDRIELLQDGDARPRWTQELLAQARPLDARTRGLHESMRATARELRKDRAAPRALAAALVNVAGGIRAVEQPLTSARGALGFAVRGGRDGSLATRVNDLDAQLDRELERDALYLEQLLDQQRADDLVRLARDVAARRRDLAGLLERYKQAPTEQGKKELLAEVARMKARLQEMMRRMGELAKGINEEHMNQEALAELMKSQDALGGLDDVQKALARGDVDAAMKALDQLGNAMQQMLAGLERTAGRPGEQNAALMKDMLAFKKQLEEVEADQQKVAAETEAEKAEYRKRVAQKMQKLEDVAQRLEKLTAEARKEVAASEKGVGLRSEDDFAQSRDRLADVQRALQGRDFDAALETARRAMPALQRLALGLADDAAIAERYRALQSKDPRELREAERHAVAALPPARRVLSELEQLFPDPRQVLPPKDQQKLAQLAQRQRDLEQRAGDLRQKLGQLAQRAPVFPQSAGEALGSSQGHMQRATGELAQRNPQRGHGEQRQALEDLQRFRRGLEELAKNSQRGGGGGFPMPFAEEQGGQGGEGFDPAQEKVEIPGADQYKVPDEFRKDLLEAMKQGAPDAYKGEVQRYYEELVK